MNKIRYRAFDKHMKAMGEVTSIRFFDHLYDQVSVRFNINGKAIDDNYNVGYDGSDNITLMQDTGLKDKNGVNIFGGDIVKYHPEANAGIGTVVYSGSGFYVGDEFNGLLDDFATIGIEVIGNIHDNPELMGGGAELIQDAAERLEELDG